MGWRMRGTFVSISRSSSDASARELGEAVISTTSPSATAQCGLRRTPSGACHAQDSLDRHNRQAPTLPRAGGRDLAKVRPQIGVRAARMLTKPVGELVNEEAGGDDGGGDSNAKNNKSLRRKVIGNGSGRAPRNGGAPAGSGSRLSRDCLGGCSCRRRRWRARSSLKRRGIHPARRARARNGECAAQIA